MSRFFVLYATERSGSTPVAFTLAHYLGARFGVTDLGEFFNPEFLGIKSRNGIITIDAKNWVPQDRPRNRTTKAKLLEVSRRMKLLEKSTGSYFLKLLVGQVESPLERSLFSKSQTFYLRRRNHLDHLLSFLISRQTGFYYLPQGIHLPAKSLIADKMQFGDFLWQIHTFEKKVAKAKSPRILYYEDLISKGPQKFVAALGYKKQISWNELTLPPRQNTGNKLKLFKNSDEILSWYRGSFLNASFPA